MDNLPEIPKAEPLVLRPASPRSEAIVRLSIQDGVLRVWSDYDGDLVQLCKRFQFRWHCPFWERQITRYNGGLIEDRLVEIAYNLLTENFIVQVSAEIEDLQLRIGSGDYTDEQTRWVMVRTKGNYDGWFAVTWRRYTENFYTEARRLTSARWSKPSVVVKSEFFDEILDFAEIHGFELSDGAKKLVTLAQTAREQSVRVELKPRTQKAKVATVEIEIGVIADELKDDD